MDARSAQGRGRRPAPLASRGLRLACCALAVLALGAGARAGPAAVAGALDLRAVDFGEAGALRLDGEWRYLPRTLADPDAVDAMPMRFATLPGVWDADAGGPADAFGSGYASYVLDVLLPADAPPLGLRLITVSSAFELSADGALVARAGRVGRTAESTAPQWAPQIAMLPAAGDDRLRLVLRVANFDHARGGPWEPIWIGPVEELRASREARVGLLMLFTGAFSIIGLYHLLLWLPRREDLSSLLFAALCFSVAVRNLTVDEVYLTSLLPDAYGLVNRLEYASLLCALASAWAFFGRIFPREIPRAVVRGYVVGSVLGLLALLVLPVATFTRALPLVQAALLFGAVLAPWYVIRALRRGREGAALFLVGLVAIAVCGIHDILLSIFRSLPTVDVFGGPIYLQPFGLLVFVLCQAAVLATGASRTLRQLEARTSELAVARDSLSRHARELEQRVAERTLDLRKANEELARQAQIDGLTKLANRRTFDEVLDAIWADHQRRGAALSLIMVDVDHFKRFNDRYGHVDGDEALRLVAGALAATMRRPRDVVARYGGEEMVALLPDTDAEGARFVADEMRERVADLGREHADSEHGRLTISVGVATCIPQRGRTPTALVELADAALYRAKGAGRNRVEAAA